MGLTPVHDVSARHKIAVAMPDGISLLASLYEPDGLDKSPTVLIRSPYGRRVFGLGIGIPLASQGYRVVIQSCRGTAGSGGRFDPHHDDKADGMATIDWLSQQSWYDGSIFTYGMSYLGYTQWAVAASAGTEVKAMAMQATMSDFSQMTYAGNSFMLENAAEWTHLVATQRRRLGVASMILGKVTRRPAISDEKWRSLPLGSLDVRTTGVAISFWNDWMSYDSADHEWWQSMNFHRSIPDISRPITLVAGWHDIFAPWSLRDFAALREVGAPARITVGPWSHTSRAMNRAGLRDAIDWFAVQRGNKPEPSNPPVKLWLQVADEWCFYHEWPPAESVGTRWYLQPSSGLAETVPESAAVDVYRYDPSDPTPSVAGPRLVSEEAIVDNRELEARSDVLCYTSAPLSSDLDVVGVPTATLRVESSAESADFFVRLCDVDESGLSLNVCDGLQRIELNADDQPQQVEVSLWPTAYRFRSGHRIRLQVSSGAFPRWARNLGTGEPLATATKMRVADQTIHLGAEGASSIVLPVISPAE